MKSATVVALLALTAACSAYDGQSDPNMGAEDVGQAEAKLTNTDGSIYKPSDTNFTYRLYGGSKFCLIQDPGELDALYGFSPGNYEGIATYANDYFLNLMASWGRSFAGHCLWPTGCFRRTNEAPVYRVTESSRSYCWLRTPTKVAQYCGSSSSYLTIKRPASEIDFDQWGWYDSSWVYHTGARYTYAGDCP